MSGMEPGSAGSSGMSGIEGDRAGSSGIERDRAGSSGIERDRARSWRGGPPLGAESSRRVAHEVQRGAVGVTTPRPQESGCATSWSSSGCWSSSWRSAASRLAQISTLIAVGKAMQAAGPPPEAVGTDVAATATWERTLSAVGSVAGAESVAVSNEVAGIVTRIGFESGAVVAGPGPRRARRDRRARAARVREGAS